MNRTEERRKSKRYNIQSGAVIILTKKSRFPFMKPKQVRLGPIIDISSSGVLFEYKEGGENMDEFSELAISTTSGRIIVDNIKFASVYDYRAEYLSNGDILRKRALKFMELTVLQKSWVSCLINNLLSKMAESGISAAHEDSPEILKEVV